MKLGSLLGELISSLFKKPVTITYPAKREEAPESFRGKLMYDHVKCSGCGLCVRDCPADALDLIVLDKANKRFVMRYNADRCTFCDQCVISCKFDALELSRSDWELANVSREPMDILYGREEDVKQVLERAAKPAGSEIPE